MFDKRKLRTRVKLTKLDFVHKGPNEKYTSTGTAQQVFRSQWIWQSLRIQPFALVSDANHEVIVQCLEGSYHLFACVIRVSMENRVYCSLPYRHGHTINLVFIQSGFLGDFFGCLLYTIHTVQGGLEGVGDFVCL